MVNMNLHKTQLIVFTVYSVIVTGQIQLYQSRNGLICQMCTVGTYLVAPCTSNKGKSSCQVCPQGTYHSQPNNITQCRECSFCRITQIETKHCSQNHDIVCKCPAGKYWHSYPGNEGICKYHTVCKYGEVIIKQGNSTADTVCSHGVKILQQHHEVGKSKPKNFKRRKGKKRRGKCRKRGIHKKTYKPEDNLRCQLCPAGTFLVLPCMVNCGRSICEPCLPDHFNSMPNRASKCEACTICPLGTNVVTVCSNRTDTVCECPKDMFWMNHIPPGYGDGLCMDYSKCKPNQVVMKNGTATTDNMCGDIEEHSPSRNHTKHNTNRLLNKNKRKKGKKRKKCKNIRQRKNRRKCKYRRLQKKKKKKKESKQRNKENIYSKVNKNRKQKI